MFPIFILFTLLALAVTLAAPVIADIAPAARAHLSFAVGIMPLILAAFCYFVPVLTRSGTASTSVRLLPWLALTAGLLAFVQFVAPDVLPFAYSVPASGALVAASASVVWMQRSGARTVGRPHPCMKWYVASAFCLAMAAAAVLAMPVWPLQYPALRQVHLHLNILGFVGLAAIGTLQVLMPTVAAVPDAGVADRLGRDLAPAMAGSLLMAAGAAWQSVLAWVGVVLWAVVLTRLAASWWRLYRVQIFAWHGLAPPLGAALAGFAGLLVTSTIQTTFGRSITNVGLVVIALFLVPLVTGAAAALLPVLLRPGVQTDWHHAFRTRAGRYSGIRALLFLLGGLMSVLGREEGSMITLLALVLFAVQIERALSGRQST